MRWKTSNGISIDATVNIMLCIRLNEARYRCRKVIIMVQKILYWCSDDFCKVVLATNKNFTFMQGRIEDESYGKICPNLRIKFLEWILIWSVCFLSFLEDCVFWMEMGIQRNTFETDTYFKVFIWIQLCYNNWWQFSVQ